MAQRPQEKYSHGSAEGRLEGAWTSRKEFISMIRPRRAFTGCIPIGKVRVLSNHLTAAVLVLGFLAVQGVGTAAADDTAIRHPREGVPPLPPNETCLTVRHDGAITYWLNHCPYAVTVRWNDDGKCRDWGCQSEIPAIGRLPAAISSHLRWCECRGTLSMCSTPTNGCR